jgi:8-oxo-dGTP pyrophosphatase MutT (NUDIX family)
LLIHQPYNPLNLITLYKPPPLDIREYIHYFNNPNIDLNLPIKQGRLSMFQEEEPVYRGRFITVTEEPQGESKGPIERVHVKPGVTVIPYRRGGGSGKIIIIKEPDLVTRSQRTKLITGYVEDGEDPKACAQREMIEETGYTSGNWVLLYEARGEPPVICDQYVWLALDPTRACEPTEVGIEAFELPVSQLPSVLYGKRALFGHSMTAQALAYFLWALNIGKFQP